MTSSYENWRALAEKELGGASFDDVLVHQTPDGLKIQPLYVEGAKDGPRARAAGGLRICMRADPATARRTEALREDLEGGADALWIVSGDDAALDAALATSVDLVVDVAGSTPRKATAWLAEHDVVGRQRKDGAIRRVMIGVDPITAAARGLAPASTLPDRLSKLADLVTTGSAQLPGAQILRVSTIQFHDSGADAGDEVAIALSTGAAYLRALIETGVNPSAAAAAIALQIAVGRDTFVEICKLRAVRICWTKLLAAFDAGEAPVPALHAVCSSRTQSRQDPWVNMLRVSTQVFAAAIGGADYVTPLAYDDVDGLIPSARGRRAARNSGLVLRDESHLGWVADAAAGSYFFESFTDSLAREAWTRFQQLERGGGVAAALIDGSLHARIEASRQAREKAIREKQHPILGVTEFVNGNEAPIGAEGAVKNVPYSPSEDRPGPVFVNHRDAESFERTK